MIKQTEVVEGLSRRSDKDVSLSSVHRRAKSPRLVLKLTVAMRVDLMPGCAAVQLYTTGAFLQCFLFSIKT